MALVGSLSWLPLVAGETEAETEASQRQTVRLAQTRAWRWCYWLKFYCTGGAVGSDRRRHHRSTPQQPPTLLLFTASQAACQPSSHTHESAAQSHCPQTALTSLAAARLTLRAAHSACRSHRRASSGARAGSVAVAVVAVAALHACVLHRQVHRRIRSCPTRTLPQPWAGASATQSRSTNCSPVVSAAKVPLGAARQAQLRSRAGVPRSTAHSVPSLPSAPSLTPASPSPSPRRTGVVLSRLNRSLQPVYASIRPA